MLKTSAELNLALQTAIKRRQSLSPPVAGQQPSSFNSLTVEADPSTTTTTSTQNVDESVHDHPHDHATALAAPKQNEQPSDGGDSSASTRSKSVNRHAGKLSREKAQRSLASSDHVMTSWKRERSASRSNQLDQPTDGGVGSNHGESRLVRRTQGSSSNLKREVTFRRRRDAIRSTSEEGDQEAASTATTTTTLPPRPSVSLTGANEHVPLIFLPSKLTGEDDTSSHAEQEEGNLMCHLFVVPTEISIQPHNATRRHHNIQAKAPNG